MALQFLKTKVVGGDGENYTGLSFQGLMNIINNLLNN